MPVYLRLKLPALFLDTSESAEDHRTCQRQQKQSSRQAARPAGILLVAEAAKAGSASTSNPLQL